MKIRELPLIKSFIETIESNFKKYGFQKGMRESFNHYKTRLIVRSLTKQTKHVLKNKSVVVVANHPYELDPFALIGTLPAREDAYLVINAINMGICPEIDKHLIPVYIRHHKTYALTRALISKLLDKYHPKAVYSPDKEHAKNIQSIALASQKIRQGGLVIIFPHRRSSDSNWFTGVGHLLKGTETNKEIYVVKAHIQGTSYWDYFRFIPGIRKFIPSIVVQYSKPVLVNGLTKYHPKEITKKLEQDYNDWVNGLN